MFFFNAISISVISNHNSFRVLFDKIASVYFLSEKYIYILALKMASPGNRHFANCSGILSFPMVRRKKSCGWPYTIRPIFLYQILCLLPMLWLGRPALLICRSWLVLLTLMFHKVAGASTPYKRWSKCTMKK